MVYSLTKLEQRLFNLVVKDGFDGPLFTKSVEQYEGANFKYCRLSANFWGALWAAAPDVHKKTDVAILALYAPRRGPKNAGFPDNLDVTVEDYRALTIGDINSVPLLMKCLQVAETDSLENFAKSSLIMQQLIPKEYMFSKLSEWMELLKTDNLSEEDQSSILTLLNDAVGLIKLDSLDEKELNFLLNVSPMEASRNIIVAGENIPHAIWVKVWDTFLKEPDFSLVQTMMIRPDFKTVGYDVLERVLKAHALTYDAEVKYGSYFLDHPTIPRTMAYKEAFHYAVKAYWEANGIDVNLLSTEVLMNYTKEKFKEPEHTGGW